MRVLKRIKTYSIRIFLFWQTWCFKGWKEGLIDPRVTLG